MPNIVPPSLRRARVIIAFSAVLFLLLSAIWYVSLPPSAHAAASDIFFSEYIEGSSFNKALEIYNGTGAPVNLGTENYVLQLHSNGSAAVSQSVSLTGIIAAGDVFVIAHGSANPAILAQADTTNNSVLNHNGDDAFVLRKGGALGAVVDSIGQAGFDPGTEWGTGLASTADNTLRRKATVCQGDTNPLDAYDPAPEWDGFAIDTFSGFGSHTATCGGAGVSVSIDNVTHSEGDSGGTTYTFTVSLSGPAPVGGVSYNISTQDDSATLADNDYQQLNLVGESIPEGLQSKTYNITVNGDTNVEPNETFLVNVTNVSGATVSDGQGVGTITNDDSQTAPAVVVISQVYGGGGNTGSTLRNDYIELINHSSAPVDLSGWSVQVFSTTTSTWQMTPLTNFILQPGQYYLVQESQGAGGTQDLPTPDAIGTIPMSSTSGKVALLNNTTILTGSCPTGSGIVDFVGYGTTDCFEGSGTAPLLSNTTADLRLNDGCFDTNDNAHDFVLGDPNPRNSSSPTNDCTALSGFGSANPSSVLQGQSTTLTVHVAPAQNPTSTGITVNADLSAIGGSANQAFAGGGSTFTFIANVPANNPPGMKSLPVTIADAQARSANTNIVLTVLPLIPDHITISQVYGGGGNSGATFNRDFVELHNPHNVTFDLTGWSLQYTSAAGDSWEFTTQPLGGTIAPGEYYLIALAGGATGADLPAPNISGDINMSATTGKIALVSNFDPLVGTCPIGDPDIVDFVGYGGTANCAEGTRAPAPSNTTALLRSNNGARDTDNNLADFATGTPNPRRTSPIVEIGPSVFGTDPRNNNLSAPRDASLTINFTEPVTVDAGWYSINCAVTGPHNSATEASFFGGDAHVITPNVNFQPGEQCTVTIFKDAIHDVDTDDTGINADTLPADFIFTFTVATGTAPPYPSSVHLTMGNPNGATADLGQPDNYLMDKPEFTLSYNRSRGGPNWVSWHLADEWIGTLARVDTFRADPAVPPDWYRVQGLDYTGSGFDRGHMVPNADRDKETSIPINQATFLMTNMLAQSPDNNQGPWASLEGHLRTLLPANEIYIVAGGAGTGGIGSAGAGTVNTIANGNVTVPAQTWKVVLVLPKASGDDVSRVTCGTQVIAVIMPNIQGIRTVPWENYIVSVNQVEALTGYDFFSNLPDNVENCLEGAAFSTAGSTLVNESCPAFNSAVDPGERVTVNLGLTNTGTAATSNLVATLLSMGGVVAPSGPQSYGAIATGGNAARDFSFTAQGTCGDLITATLQLQDGANNLGTVTYTFRLGVDTGGGFACTNPCGGVRLVVTSQVTRTDGSTVQGAVTVQNIGSETANNVTITTAKLGSTIGAPLPQSLGSLAPGATVNAVVTFANSTPGASSVFNVGGTYTGGTFSTSKRVTIP